MKIEIKNQWTGYTKFECKLPEWVAGMSYGEQIGYAIREACESGINLANADLAGANLAGANLANVDLTNANLANVDLTNANLAGANLANVDLTNANLAGANLADANLADANLADANLADRFIAMTRILPDGELIGWKKCQDGVIVKLRVPADARRVQTLGRKCRAEFVDVLEVIGAEVGISHHDGETEYRAGERVVADRFDDDWRRECAPGIHFFITRAEAEAF